MHMIDIVTVPHPPIDSVRIATSYWSSIWALIHPPHKDVYSAQRFASSLLPTNPIKNSPIATVLNPKFLPSTVPMYPLTAALNFTSSVRGKRRKTSSSCRWRISMCMADPNTPRCCFKAAVRAVRHVRMSGGCDGSGVVNGGSKILGCRSAGQKGSRAKALQ